MLQDFAGSLHFRISVALMRSDPVSRINSAMMMHINICSTRCCTSSLMSCSLQHAVLYLVSHVLLSVARGAVPLLWCPHLCSMHAVLYLLFRVLLSAARGAVPPLSCPPLCTTRCCISSLVSSLQHPVLYLLSAVPGAVPFLFVIFKFNSCYLLIITTH